jgi:hypothetical protein
MIQINDAIAAVAIICRDTIHGQQAMHPELVAGPLSDDMIDQSWPVAQYLVPELSIEAWREQIRRPVPLQCACAAQAPAPARHMVVRCARRYIHGLARYAVSSCEKEGRVLLVDGAVAIGLIDTELPAVALFEGLVAEAGREGCSALRVRMPESRTWMVARLDTAGREAALAIFMRCVNAPVRSGAR